MIWHIIGYWLSFFLPTFYKRIQGHNLHHLYTDDPVIIAMNHPNAFTDPIAFSYMTFPRRLYYMARGDAFKPGLAAWLLEKIGIVPIFRMQDAGREGLKKNDEAYRLVNRLLKKNAKVIVFAEGLCVQERRLRPIKKGVARMVFGAHRYLGHDRLKVIPVGVNYSKPDKFRSKLLYNVGEPMLVRDYIAAYEENPARTMNTFIQELEARMKQLVIHIPIKDQDELVHWIEKLRKKDMLREQRLNEKKLFTEFEVSKQIVDQVQTIAENDPDLLHAFKKEARLYFESLRSANFKDWLFRPEQQAKNTAWYLAGRLMLFLLLAPVYFTGMLANLPPLVITDRLTRRFVKDVEFYSSVALGISMFVFPIIYGLWFSLFYIVYENLLIALTFCLLLALCGGACLLIHPFLLRTAGLFRYLRKRADTSLIHRQRAALTDLLNKFFRPGPRPRHGF